MTATLQPFRIDIPQAALDDLHARLERTRWPERLPGSGWSFGTDEATLRRFHDRWRDVYDWRAEEAVLNGFEQHLAEVDGERVHLLHVPSPNPDAVPLVLLHGWPGSVVEFLDAAALLSDEFHVVVPSMPGYGFSGPTRTSGVDGNRIAAMVVDVMGALGYDRFVAQGGDWGAIVARRLGEAHADHVLGIHVTMCFAFPGPDAPDPMAGVTEADQARMQRSAARVADGLGYMAIQSTRPDTLAAGLHDSPVGLLAWILEKFQAWSDLGDGVLEDVYDPDRLLTNVMLYWLTGTAGSAARLYAESQRARSAPTAAWTGRVEVPTGHAVYPGELLQTPRAWAEQRYRIVHWTEQQRGGHFAAFEQPALFAEDVRAFCRLLR